MRTALRSNEIGTTYVHLSDLCSPDLEQVLPGTADARTMPYVGMEDIETNTGRVLGSSHQGEVRSNTFAFDTRHVLYGKLRPYLNKVALPDRSGRCSTELIPLLPVSGVDRQYLAWLLRRPETVSAAMQGKTGSRMPRANMSELFSLIVPLFPLPEQKRIAAKLDEQMATLAKAQAALAAQREAATALRSAVLRTALDPVTHPGWRQSMLKTFCSVIDSTVDPQRNPDEEFAHYSIPAFDGGHGPVMELGKDIHSNKLELHSGSVLFSKLNPRIPRVWYVQDDVAARRICSTEFLVLQPDAAVVNSVYLTWMLQTPVFLHAVRSRVQAATKSRERVPDDIVLSTFIPLPPLPEQKHIAERLNSSAKQIDAVVTSLDDQAATLDSLRTSLLDAAFSGQV